MLGLGDCLHLVIAKLPLADRFRLSRTCRELRSACHRTVRQAKLCQEDFEQELQLPCVERLWLHKVECTDDLADYVAAAFPDQLQQLQALRISLPDGAGGLAQLLACCSSLTSLTVEGDCSISWPGVPEASQPRPRQLQQLALHRNSHITPGQLVAWLSREPAAESDTSDAAGRCAGLQRLLLQDEQPSQLLPAWPQLTTLDLSGCNQLGGCWSFLALCPGVQQLVLHSCYKVTNGTLQAFATAVAAETGDGSTSSGDGTEGKSSGASRLELCALNLAYTRVSDGMAPLAAALSGLRCLSLKGCNVGDDGLLPLLRLPRLTSLNIKHCHRVTEEGIQQLSLLQGLRSLAYGFTSMPDADKVAACIAEQFTQLTALDLLMSELTNRGLAALGAGLPQLRHFRLYQAGVTDDALRMFGEQPGGRSLQSLVLYGLGGLRDLRCLGSFPALQQLQLGSLCDLASMPGAVAQLSALTRLQQLTLERMDGVSVQCLRQVLLGCRGSLVSLRVRGCDGVSAVDVAERVAAEAAAICRSSASVWWAASGSCDTDDEEEGWQRASV